MKKLVVILCCTLLFLNSTIEAQVACNSPELKQLEFMIGEWESYDKIGNLEGKSEINIVLGSCIIEEKWEGADGINSQSTLNFDMNSEKWHQVWSDDFGNIQTFEGKMKNGKLTLKSETIDDNGKKVYHKVTYSKGTKGQIQHSWKTSKDNKNWKTVFEGNYKKKKPCL